MLDIYQSLAGFVSYLCRPSSPARHRKRNRNKMTRHHVLFTSRGSRPPFNFVSARSGPWPPCRTASLRRRHWAARPERCLNTPPAHPPPATNPRSPHPAFCIYVIMLNKLKQRKQRAGRCPGGCVSTCRFAWRGRAHRPPVTRSTSPARLSPCGGPHVQRAPLCHAPRPPCP